MQDAVQHENLLFVEQLCPNAAACAAARSIEMAISPNCSGESPEGKREDICRVIVTEKIAVQAANARRRRASRRSARPCHTLARRHGELLNARFSASDGLQMNGMAPKSNVLPEEVMESGEREFGNLHSGRPVAVRRRARAPVRC